MTLRDITFHMLPHRHMHVRYNNKKDDRITAHICTLIWGLAWITGVCSWRQRVTHVVKRNKSMPHIVVITPRFLWQLNLWNIAIQPTVGCYKSWANLRCSHVFYNTCGDISHSVTILQFVDNLGVQYGWLPWGILYIHMKSYIYTWIHTYIYVYIYIYITRSRRSQTKTTGIMNSMFVIKFDN